MDATKKHEEIKMIVNDAIRQSRNNALEGAAEIAVLIGRQLGEPAVAGAIATEIRKLKD